MGVVGAKSTRYHFGNSRIVIKREIKGPFNIDKRLDDPEAVDKPYSCCVRLGG